MSVTIVFEIDGHMKNQIDEYGKSSNEKHRIKITSKIQSISIHA